MCRARGTLGTVQAQSAALAAVEQGDLIRYGLIPEFVGRLPIVSALQVGTRLFLRLCARSWDSRPQPCIDCCRQPSPPAAVFGCVWLGIVVTIACALSCLPTHAPFRINPQLTTSPASPACPCLQALSEEELAHVLCQPKNALAKQYAGIFGKNNCK